MQSCFLNIPPPPPNLYQGQEFHPFCNCTKAISLDNNTFQILPHHCSPIENITCSNGKKPVLLYDKFQCCQHYACDCESFFVNLVSAFVFVFCFFNDICLFCFFNQFHILIFCPLFPGECKGWGNHHYITFDGFYYNYQGNCTYVLMQEINPRHHLRIYIDNVFDSTEDVSRLRSIIILNGSQIFNLTNHNLTGRSNLEVKQGPVILYCCFDLSCTGSYTVFVYSIHICLKSFKDKRTTNRSTHC